MRKEELLHHRALTSADRHQAGNRFRSFIRRIGEGFSLKAFIGLPGHRKTSMAGDFTDRLASVLPEITVKQLTFDQCFQEILKRGHVDKYHFTTDHLTWASTLLECSGRWVRDNLEPPLVLVIQTPAVTHPYPDLGGQALVNIGNYFEQRGKCEQVSIDAILSDYKNFRANLLLRRAAETGNIADFISISKKLKLRWDTDITEELLKKLSGEEATAEGIEKLEAKMIRIVYGSYCQGEWHPSEDFTAQELELNLQKRKKYFGEYFTYLGHKLYGDSFQLLVSHTVRHVKHHEIPEKHLLPISQIADTLP